MKKVSIITVNLNNFEGLTRTMESVLNQTYTDYEYVIVDGGSTDGSREFIEKHADRLSYWCRNKRTIYYLETCVAPKTGINCQLERSQNI